MPALNSKYRAPAWLPGGHAQTIYPLLIKPAQPDYRRERWETPDGDFIDLDWCGEPSQFQSPTSNGKADQPDFASTDLLTQAGNSTAPLLVLFHGLEGSSASHYAIALMQAVRQRGWLGVVPHFRGCSGEPNRLPRAYHSGDSAEIDWILRRLRHASPNRPMLACGVSLGGNALLKWLGEQGSAASALVAAAAVICAPLDLTACGLALGKGFNRVYTHNFLRTMKRAMTDKLRRFPAGVDARRMASARSLYEFDDAVTAPLHGFAGVEDYWRRASAKPLLSSIAAPTLLLNARNDPFVPHQALPQPSEVSATVTLEFPDEGGHVGFVSGDWPGHLDWLPGRLLNYFDDHIARE